LKVREYEKTSTDGCTNAFASSSLVKNRFVSWMAKIFQPYIN